MHKIIKTAFFLLFISSVCSAEHYIETTGLHKDGSKHYLILADNGYILGSATDAEITEEGFLVYQDPKNNDETRLIEPLSVSTAQKITSQSYELN